MKRKYFRKDLEHYIYDLHLNSKEIALLYGATSTAVNQAVLRYVPNFNGNTWKKKQSKICPDCGIEFPRSEFERLNKNTGRLYLHHCCAKCTYARLTEYKKSHREQYKAYKAEYAKAHPEQHRIFYKKWWKKQRLNNTPAYIKAMEVSSILNKKRCFEISKSYVNALWKRAFIEQGLPVPPLTEEIYQLEKLRLTIQRKERNYIQKQYDKSNT